MRTQTRSSPTKQPNVATASTVLDAGGVSNPVTVPGVEGASNASIETTGGGAANAPTAPDQQSGRGKQVSVSRKTSKKSRKSWIRRLSFKSDVSSADDFLVASPDDFHSADEQTPGENPPERRPTNPFDFDDDEIELMRQAGGDFPNDYRGEDDVSIPDPGGSWREALMVRGDGKDDASSGHPPDDRKRKADSKRDEARPTKKVNQGAADSRSAAAAAQSHPEQSRASKRSVRTKNLGKDDKPKETEKDARRNRGPR